MRKAFFRERLERLLREPDNLFGPPTGRGYDHLRAGLTVAALALAALSVWCRVAVEIDPARHPALAGLLLLLAAPSYTCGWFLWPLHLAVGGVGAAVVWYATLHTAACRTGLRPCGWIARLGSTVVSVAGWVVGLAVVIIM